jgi:transmembrane sensor
MLSEEQFSGLLDKYKNGTISIEELEALHEHINSMAQQGNDYLFASADEKEAMKERAASAIFTEVNATTTVKKTLPVRRNIVIAFAIAASLLAVIATVYLLTSPASKYVTVASHAGQVLRYTLPDGTALWLNDSSAVTFNSTGFAANRSISLTRGEAFFDVKKDAAHPFVIHSGLLSTTVKGTSFSVKLTDSLQNIKVSVVTGRVAVSIGADTLNVLHPGQRFKLNNRLHQSIVDTVQDDEANGWIQGDIVMQNASLAEIQQWLQNKFSITVINKISGYSGSYNLQVNSTITIDEAVKLLNLLCNKNKVYFIKHQSAITIQNRSVIF